MLVGDFAAEFKPCLIIPIYNHSKEFSSVIPKLRGLGLPAIIVDDGSSEPNRQMLADLLVDESWATLYTLNENQGKGGAVCCALTEACEAGYSHALQIDADGQHNFEDVHQFLTVSQESPEAVVTAVRRYLNAPKSRMYGRKVTDFWVWVNTLSFHIQDSMCGFRLYPLHRTLNAIDLNSLSKRMDFDTDVLVKLYWAGVEIRQIHTDVTYAGEISSHFDVLRDNVRISLMHARLFFGMLLRVPKLIVIAHRYRASKNERNC